MVSDRWPDQRDVSALHHWVETADILSLSVHPVITIFLWDLFYSVCELCVIILDKLRRDFLNHF